MAEQITGRPEGGREGDFSELNDWTVTDIATAPHTSPEDRQNAKAEIARRKEEGTYSPEDSTQNTQTDLLNNGYGVQEGKITYPTAEYKEFMNSDRSGEVPTGVVRESLEDRVKNAEALPKIEDQQAMGQLVNKVEPESFDNDNQSDNEEDLYNEWGFNINEPRRERMIRTTERVKKVPIEHAEKTPETVEDRINKAYNYYEDNFTKSANKWAAYGVSNLVEKGALNLRKTSAITSGFLSHEGDRVHNRIDPDNEYTDEVIDGELNLKTRVSRDLIFNRSDELSDEEFNKAKHDGLLYSIYSGARKQEMTERPIFAIPVENGDKVVELMKENGINPKEEGVQLLSYNGFFNVIDAIKDDNKATEQGFKVLDWYANTFNYKKHMSELMDKAEDKYEDDEQFKNKFEEYLDYRLKAEKEAAQERIREREAREKRAIAESRPIEYDKLNKFLLDNLEFKESRDIFEDGNHNFMTGAYANLESLSKGEYPSIRERSAFALEQAKIIHDLDPDAADFRYSRVFDSKIDEEDSENKEYDERSATHIVIRFGYNNNNNVVAIPIDKQSRAMFVWKGQTGEDRDGWTPAFKGSSRERDKSVERKVCSGYSREGFYALKRQWERVWDFFGGLPEGMEVTIPDVLLENSEKQTTIA